MLEFNFVEFFIVSGSLQCIIFSVFLLMKSKEKYRKQNTALLIFILIYSFVIIKGWYIGSEIYLNNPFFLFFPLYLTLGVGPSFYVFVSYLLKKDFKFGKQHIIHIIPSLIQFGFHFFAFCKPQHEHINYFNKVYLPYILPFEEIMGMISIAFYFHRSYRILKEYQKLILNNFTDVRKLLYTWLSKCIWLLLILLLIWFCFFLTDFFVYDYQQDYTFYYPIYLMIVSVLFWLIIEAFFNPSKIKSEYHFNHTSQSYQLPNQQKQKYLKKLLDVMSENKPFLNPKLTIKDLAEEIDILPKYLSQIINNELNKTFYDFVNTYRINFAKKELLSSKNKHLTIVAISLQCGFNSKSTFNDVFKKVTGLTPTSYIKSHTKE